MGKRLALLIGNQEYDDPTLSTLQKPGADVQALAKVLSNRNIGAFDEVIPILDETKSTVERHIDELFTGRKSDDLLLLFFAGHGIKDTTDITDEARFLYLACKDTKKDRPLSSAVSSRFVTTAMNKSMSRSQILILDCCYSGAFPKHTRSGIVGAPVDTDEAFRGNGTGKVVLTASNSVQFAYEGTEVFGESQNSVFTHYLIDGLKSGKADFNKDGKVTIDELYRYIYDNVISHSKQTPQKYVFDYEGEMFLAKVPKPAAPKAKVARKTIPISDEATKNIAVVKDKVYPLLKDLGQNALAQNMHQKALDLETMLTSTKNMPVMLLGLTGVGKTSLMNAMLGKILGRAQGGQAQSATALVVSHQQHRFNCEAVYISPEEMLTLVNRAYLEKKNDKDLSKRPDEQQLPQQVSEFLSTALKNPDIGHKKEILMDDLDETLVNLILGKKQEKNFYENEYEGLIDFLVAHTNSSGKYWAITRELNVSGPFPGLSPHVTIMDLPGLGDLNEIRVEKTREALKVSDQIIIVVDERGLINDIKIMLSENQIISYMLTNPRIAQITIVGTKLDDPHINPDEHKELGIKEDASVDEIVQGKFGRWKKVVRKQWKDLLLAWARNTNVAGSENPELIIERIIKNTDFIPCSPNGFLCTIGLVKDRKNYSEIFENKETTGIPAVVSSVSRLADEQKHLRKVKIERAYQSFKGYARDISSTLGSISKDISYSKKLEMCYQTVSGNLASLADKTETAGLDVNLADVNKRMLKTESIVQKGWKTLDQKTIERLLNDILGKLHFQTFLAVLRRRGILKSKGKEKIEVHIPSNMSTYVVEPMVRYVNDDVLKQFIKNNRSKIMTDTTNLHAAITKIIDESFRGESGSAVDLFKEQSQGFLKQHANDMESLCEQALAGVDKLNINTLDLAYESVGDGFQAVMHASLETAQGSGARQRTIDELVKQVNQKKPEIMHACSSAFIARITGSLKMQNAELEKSMRERRKNVLNNILEYGQILFSKHRIKDQKNKIKELADILQAI